MKAIVPPQPDAVVQISAYKTCAAFIREARKAGYGGTFYNVSFVGTQALADELGKEGRGIMVSQVMPFPFSTTHADRRASTSTAVQQRGGDAQAELLEHGRLPRRQGVRRRAAPRRRATQPRER